MYLNSTNQKKSTYRLKPNAYKKCAILEGNLNNNGRCNDCCAKVHVGSEKNLEYIKIYIVSGKENCPHYTKQRTRIAQQNELASEISKLTASTYITLQMSLTKERLKKWKMEILFQRTSVTKVKII